MVRLTKIYTRTGDKGRTMLGDGGFTEKHAPRVEAYGAVDEANAALGLAVAACADDALASLLRSAQNDLFDVGADLCRPRAAGEKPDEKLRVTRGQIDRLEKAIDERNADLAPLESFVLPGGTELAARLHAARTIVRRAERRVAALLSVEPDATGAEPMVYLNRLSDLLFVLARVANGGGSGDVLWKPGAGRS